MKQFLLALSVLLAITVLPVTTSYLYSGRSVSHWDGGGHHHGGGDRHHGGDHHGGGHHGGGHHGR